MSTTLSKIRNRVSFVFLLLLAGVIVYVVVLDKPLPGMVPADPPKPVEMQVDQTQWLDDRYVAGAEAWTAPGTPLGLSKDRTTMLVESGSSISGHDLRTGEERWASTDVSCKGMDVIDGEALCVPNGFDETFTLAVVDVSTGDVTMVDTGVPGSVMGIVGAHEDAWIVEGIGGDVSGTLVLSVNRDGSVNWQQTIDFLSTTCVVLDHRIGCDDIESVVLLNAATGERESKIAGNRNVRWFRDAVMIDGVVHEFSGEVRDVNWLGPEARFPMFPGPSEGAFYTVQDVRRNGHLLDASGRVLVTATWKHCDEPDDDREDDPYDEYDPEATRYCNRWRLQFTGDGFPLDPGDAMAVTADGGLLLGKEQNSTVVLDSTGEVVLTASGGARLVDGIIVTPGDDATVHGPKGQ